MEKVCPYLHIVKTLKKISKTAISRALIFGMSQYVVDIYKDCSNDSPGIKIDPVLGGHCFSIYTYNKNFKKNFFIITTRA